jgi:hypothetical protein
VLVESKVDAGSKFVMRLPMKSPHLPDLSATQPLQPPALAEPVEGEE